MTRLPTRADVVAATRPGDAYPLHRPTAIYEHDECDEMTLCALAVLDTLRVDVTSRYGGSPTGRAFCHLIDDHARDLITRNHEDEDDQP